MDDGTTPKRPPAFLGAVDYMEANNQVTEDRTHVRSLDELYASDLVVPKGSQHNTEDDTAITSQISDYGNDLRQDSHNFTTEELMPDAPDDNFSSFPEDFTGDNRDSAITKHLNNSDLEINKPKAKRRLLPQLWAALITARKSNQSKDTPSTEKFLPRTMLIKICSFEAVFDEVRPYYGLEEHALKCTEYICGKKDQPEFDNAKCSREIFAILILIKAVESMPDFLRAGIRDDHLPFSANREVNELRTRQGEIITCLEAGNDTLEFYNRQWWVHVPYLGPQEYIGPQEEDRRARCLILAAPTVMPWTFMDDATKEGGFGSVRKVRIHKDYHNFFPQEFALKTLTDTPFYNEKVFEQETHVLSKIGSRPHIVELCASFIIGDFYMMLFPWAEGGNLAAVWEAIPATLILSPGEEHAEKAEFVEWVARQGCGLVEVLHEFHGYFENKFKDKEGRDQYGIHGDIKPANILYFPQDKETSPMGTLKLADFGLARFHRARSRSGKPWSSAGAATQTYRSPEHDIGPVRSRKVDMWSLGCVFSEFCTWLIKGPDALKEYNDARTSEQDKSRKGIWKEDNFFVKYREDTYLQANKETCTEIPKLKNTVSKWIAKLSEECVCGHSPIFLQDFLSFIQHEMLHPDREQRADCDKVKGFLMNCLEKGHGDPAKSRAF